MDPPNLDLTNELNQAEEDLRLFYSDEYDAELEWAQTIEAQHHYLYEEELLHTKRVD